MTIQMNYKYKFVGPLRSGNSDMNLWRGWKSVIRGAGPDPKPDICRAHAGLNGRDGKSNLIVRIWTAYRPRQLRSGDTHRSFWDQSDSVANWNCAQE